MSSKENRQLQEFFVIVNRGIRKHGINEIVKSIQAIDLQENNMFYNDIIKFISIAVTEEFSITHHDLISLKKRGVISTARMIAIMLSKHHLSISDEQLGKHFNRVRQVIYRMRKQYEKYDRKNKLDDEFFYRYDRINEKLVNYIKQLKE